MNLDYTDGKLLCKKCSKNKSLKMELKKEQELVK